MRTLKWWVLFVVAIWFAGEAVAQNPQGKKRILESTGIEIRSARFKKERVEKPNLLEKQFLLTKAI